MANSYFQFKKFIVHQNNCAMKVGTDGVLLGSWTNINNVNTVLDIGTGTGLLSLMIAQRNEQCNIIAIEIDNKAAKQATENFNISKWKNRITSINIPFQQYYKSTKNKFDLIICNPPYFINSKPAQNKTRNIARHDIQLSFVELLLGISKILNANGKFCLIVPNDISDYIIHEANKNKLYCTHILCIKPKENKPILRKLIEFSFIESPIVENELFIEINRHEYSTEYKNLTKDFYLKL